VSTGENHTLILTKSGIVYSFGSNSDAQLGINNIEINNFFLPTPIQFLEPVSNIFASKFHSIITTNLISCNGINQFDSNVCNNNGNCINNKCECSFGYFGANCENTTCYNIISTNNTACSSNGECTGFILFKKNK
jgi:alpha-tubulin suppressor-like RCC1 family protein